MNKILLKKTANSPIYVIDFLNIFSDFREIKYKKLNIDFHKVKHINKVQDTLDFFKIFFTKYSSYTRININGTFLFVLKKITNYDETLYKILDFYKHINIRFIIIESKYENYILDKNKDDFVCQYICSYLLSNNNCILISNDKYRDKSIYVSEFENNFNDTLIRIINKTDDKILIENTVLNIEKIICHNILSQVYKRCSIPKNKLKNIL